MKKLFGKMAMAIALVLTLIVGSIGFVACDNPKDSTSGGGDTNYNVTFHYDFDPTGGYDAQTKRPDAYKKSEVLVSEKGAGVTVSRTLQRKFNCVKGYQTAGYSTESWKTAVTADMDVYVLYEKLPTYAVTFKNVDGTVVETVEVAQGTEYTASEFPANVTYIIDTTAYNALDTAAKGAYEAYSAKAGWYILTAQKSGYIVVETGKVFDKWAGDLGDMTEDVVFNAITKDADVQVKKMASGSSIAVDGDKDASYVHVSSLPMRFASTDCTYLDKYASREEALAVSEDEALKYDKAKTAYEDSNGDAYALETYMAWDGEWIYIFMEVVEPTVGTYGKEAMDAVLGGHQRTDSPELWFNLGGEYASLKYDAFGYKFVSPDYPYAYESNMTYVTKLVGGTFDLTTWDGSAVITDATGYNVEVKIPAYANPSASATPSTDIGGEGWGAKVSNGMSMVISTSLHDISNVLSADSLTEIKETGSADGVKAQLGHQNIGGGWTIATPNTSKTDYRVFDTTLVFVD